MRYTVHRGHPPRPADFDKQGGDRYGSNPGALRRNQGGTGGGQVHPAQRRGGGGDHHLWRGPAHPSGAGPVRKTGGRGAGL